MSAPTLSPQPTVSGSTAVGFKDWALVCAALGSGRQSLILRKGGIAEGRDGFRFKHEKFFLFPTQYHQQSALVRPEELGELRPDPAPPEGTVTIRLAFVLQFAVWVDDWTKLERLQSFHIWRDEVVRDRFRYDGQNGLQCAFGRVFRLETPWSFPDRPGYGGCRSWVNLPEPPPGPNVAPVLDDETHEARAREIRAILQIS